MSVANVHAQTPGQIPVFDQPGTGACNNAGGNDCVDSVITQLGGNIGIGTTTPAAKLDVVGGNLNQVDRPILGRATDYVKSDHQVKSASQELAGQPSVQPANPSAFHTLTLRISVRTDWTG